MYKVAIQRANGSVIVLLSENETDLIEVASIAVFNMKHYYTGARILYETDSTIKLVGRINSEGKYIKKED